MSFEREKELRIHLVETLVRTVLAAHALGGLDAVRRVHVEWVTEEHIRYFAGLSLQEFRALLEVPVSPFRSALICTQCDLLQQIADRRRQETAELERLIRAGASLPLLAAEYGMTGEDYAALRRRLGVTGNGRPPLLSESQERQVHELWHSTHDLPSRQRWLALADAGLPLQSVWAHIQRDAAGTAEDEPEISNT